MASETTLTLPVIDFSTPNLEPGTLQWKKVKSQVRKAAEESGCFQAIVNHIPEELEKGIQGAMQEIFDLPLETKKLNVSELPFHGYIGTSPNSLYESIGIFHPESLNKVRTFTNLMWPRGNIDFSQIMHSFSVLLSELDQMVRRMIVESFGVEKYLEEHLNSTYNIMKLHKYEAPQTSEIKTGLRSHTDKNTTTILYQNQIDGLEVQSKNGDWIKVEFSPDSLVYIIGESLNVWTNGRLYSPPHRVMMSGNETRYSAGFFVVPKESYVIKAIEELVDEQHPLKFKPFRYPEYLRLRFADTGRNYEAPLEDYFGAQ